MHPAATRTVDLPPEHRVDPGAAISEAEDCLTKAEKTLAAQGQSELANRMRAAVHDAIRTDAVASVEAVTFGRVSR